MGDVYSKAEGCWLPSFSASQSQLVQSSKRLWAKAPLEHVFSNLEPATVYSIHVRAYSAERASQDSASIHASNMGSMSDILQPCRAPGLGQTELPTSSSRFLCSPCCPRLPLQSAQCHLCAGLVGAATPAGSIQGFRLFHHKLPAARFEGPCFWLALSVPFSTKVWVRPGTVLRPPPQ